MHGTKWATAGAVVRLKSGGVLTTFERIHKQRQAVCVWFDERGRVRRAIFPATALELVRQ